ncbi:MAG: hypothetical protein ABJB97_10470, partial [Acidobacteriota bacterium]
MKSFPCKHLTQIFFAISLLAMIGVAATGAASQEQPLRSITYRLSMSRPVSHLFEVNIDVALPEDVATESLDFQMPRWSPGRYAVFDFAKNVQEVQAYVANCTPRLPSSANCQIAPLTVARLDNQTWRVATRGTRQFTVSYKVFANDLSGTFSQLDARHANYNGGSIFMYIVNHKPDPVKLVINPPSGWRVINGWTEQTDQHE